MGFSAPRTVNGLDPFECISAIQKYIRRAGEDPEYEMKAMLLAIEMARTSKAYLTMVCNRLEIISHEDCDTAAEPWIVPFVATCIEQTKRHTKPLKSGGMSCGLSLGNAVRALSRAQKSREADHFLLLSGRIWEDEGPGEIPDFALDMHTRRGRKLKRGQEHFKTEGAKLVQPPPEEKNRRPLRTALVQGDERAQDEQGSFFELQNRSADGCRSAPP